jgi:hypothetical protein
VPDIMGPVPTGLLVKSGVSMLHPPGPIGGAADAADAPNMALAAATAAIAANLGLMPRVLFTFLTSGWLVAATLRARPRVG